MREGTTRQRVMFAELFDKPVVAQFDHPHGSSDGGAVLLQACDERLRLTERIAACSSVNVVSTPKAMGTPVAVPASMIPCETAEAMYSKCIVSPLIRHPRQTTAS